MLDLHTSGSETKTSTGGKSFLMNRVSELDRVLDLKREVGTNVHWRWAPGFSRGIEEGRKRRKRIEGKKRVSVQDESTHQPSSTPVLKSQSY